VVHSLTDRAKSSSCVRAGSRVSRVSNGACPPEGTCTAWALCCAGSERPPRTRTALTSIPLIGVVSLATSPAGGRVGFYQKGSEAEGNRPRYNAVTATKPNRFRDAEAPV